MGDKKAAGNTVGFNHGQARRCTGVCRLFQIGSGEAFLSFGFYMTLAVCDVSVEPVKLLKNGKVAKGRHIRRTKLPPGRVGGMEPQQDGPLENRFVTVSAGGWYTQKGGPGTAAKTRSFHHAKVYFTGRFAGVSRVWTACVRRGIARATGAELRAVPNRTIHGAEKVVLRKRQLREEGSYKAGKVEGSLRTWRENRQLRSEKPFKGGKTKGLVRGWYKNGQLAVENSHRNGLMQGPLSTWYWNGQLRQEATHTGGKHGWQERRAVQAVGRERETQQ